MTTPNNTPDTENLAIFDKESDIRFLAELQSTLISMIELCNKARTLYPDKPLSFHVCPDSSWCSLEHTIPDEGLDRLPPDCHIVLVKI